MARIDKRINELTPSTQPLLGTDLVAIWATNSVPHTRHQTIDVITNFVNNALTGITSFDTFVTGTTLNLNTLVLGMNQGLPDLTVDLSPLITSNDTFVTGTTLNLNTLVLSMNQGLPDLTVDLSTIVIPASGITSDTYVDNASLSGNTLVFDKNDNPNAFTVDLTPILSGLNGKYVESFNFTGSTTSTITHGLGDEDVHVQVKDSTGTLITPNTVNNYTTNSVDINVSSTETMKVIIIG